MVRGTRVRCFVRCSDSERVRVCVRVVRGSVFGHCFVLFGVRGLCFVLFGVRNGCLFGVRTAWVLGIATKWLGCSGAFPLGFRGVSRWRVASPSGVFIRSSGHFPVAGGIAEGRLPISGYFLPGWLAACLPGWLPGCLA